MYRAFSVFLCFLFVFVTQARAETEYPPYSNLYVNDYAAIIDRRDEIYIQDALEALRTETGIEFTVLTIRNTSLYDHHGPIEPFATGLFNHWGIGNAAKNDGVLMLISRNDRKMRIEVGSGYGRTKDRPMKRIIDNIIIPDFKRDAYSSGIRRGVDAVVYDLAGYYPGDKDSGFVTRSINRVDRFIDRFSGWFVAALAAIFGGAALVYKRWRRRSPRKCPRDGSRMSRLDEDQDNEHLYDGQKTEEHLKSVDYDVWTCRQCDHVTIEAYRSWYTRYGACRLCNYQTLQGDTTILNHATTSSTGLKRIDYHCHNCRSEYSATVTIARISNSSSRGGGSSFGGGSSSGGGASGSW
ncbi:TPM domain-containing protein [Halocynthiibacter namhaensis]|uniref:TPM domain-containing protein n=1 Tax=Halocynthiibacter namhaensis TaxID=1290553 RepID=UPI000579915E